MPEMDMSEVVLPAPLAPIKVTISPEYISRLIPFKAWMLP